VGCGGGDPQDLEFNSFNDSLVVNPHALPEAAFSGQLIYFGWYLWLYQNGAWGPITPESSEAQYVSTDTDYSDFITVGSGQAQGPNLNELAIEIGTPNGVYAWVEGVYFWVNPNTGALDGWAASNIALYDNFDLLARTVTTAPWCWVYPPVQSGSRSRP
jgi:hypothetical protein